MNLDINNKKQCKKILKELVSIINSKAIYADVLIIENSNLVVRKDFSTIDISNSGELGLKMRAFDGEKFSEIFTTDLSYENLKKLAKSLADRTEIKKHGIAFKDDKAEKSFAGRPLIKPGKIGLDKKVKVIEKTITYLKKQKHLKNAVVMYEEEPECRIFCSKNKFLTQKISKAFAICMGMVQTKTGETRYTYELILKPGFEAAKFFPRIAKTASEEAKKLINAKKIKPGKYHCVLGYEVAGLLAHESFGHGMESDTVYKDRALSKEWKGKRIAADFVSIVEDPSIKNCNGSYYFDDEGNLSKTTHLVKNGIVNDYITEMLSAEKMGVRRSANGRCESFDHKAYARMSVTLFAKGKSNLKEMIKKVKDGIYLYGGGGGMEDPKGWGVQLQGNFGQRIKNGKLVEEYYDDIGVTGYLPTILGNIKEVSKEFGIRNTGRCGKGHKEWVPVSEGGAYLRIENLDLA